MACDGGTAAGIAIGSIFGTLLVVGVVLAILYVLWRRKQTKENANTTATWKSTENPIYDNKAFTKDAEVTESRRPQNGDANKVSSADLPASYTECRERISPGKNKDEVDSTAHAGRSKAKKTRRNLFTDSRGKANTIDFPIHKTGSHSSLDGAVTPNYPEVISVSLQSQDIIGLGFNISGSLSEGIFVSQVHNRGPASESGKIQVGDRILSITISMTNMVYEDALTILSYASPYPVILQLQKAMPLLSDDPAMEDNAKLNHPIYRSQSLDDLSKINRDRWTGPRKTWTQIRRVHPTREEDREEIEGQLKKWSATQNIVSEEAGLVQPLDIKSSASNISTDISLDMDEIINASGSLLTSTPGSAQVVQVEIPDQSTSFAVVPDLDDIDEHGMKRKSTEATDTNINVDDSGVAFDAPLSKRSKESSSEEDEPFANGLQQEKETSDIQDLSEAKLEQITVDFEDIAEIEVSKGDNKDENDKSSDSSSSKRSSISNESVSSLSSDSIAENGVVAVEVQSAEAENHEFEENKKETNSGEKTVTFADINENKIILEKSIDTADENSKEQEFEGEEGEDAEEEEEVTEEDRQEEEEQEEGMVKEEAIDTVKAESRDVSALSTEVHVEESIVLQDNLGEVSMETPPETDAHEDEVRAVLKDYFSDDPSLLEQFGFVGADLGSLSKTVEISTSVTQDGKTVTSTTTETVESGETIEAEKLNAMVKGGDGKGGASKKATLHEESGSEDETIPKGGIAYYVRIDEGLEPPSGSAPFNYDYNPKGIMNKPQLIFSDGTMATTSDPTEIASLSNHVGKRKASKQRYTNTYNGYGSDGAIPASHDEPHPDKTIESERVTVIDSDPAKGAFLMHINSQDSNA